MVAKKVVYKDSQMDLLSVELLADKLVALMEDMTVDKLADLLV
jgi:hypothetical protein